MEFEKYTERARGFLQSAQGLAIRSGHQKFTPDHIGKVLLDDEQGMAARLIQTAGGLSAVTDYTGFVGSADFVPDVVTMNHAHETHWTAFPDPDIRYVLRGWGEMIGQGIDHYLDMGEMLVRNVSTDIRSPTTSIENLWKPPATAPPCSSITRIGADRCSRTCS